MLKNATYIYDNVVIADEVNTTKKYCQKAQVGVDLTLRSVSQFTTSGYIAKDKTRASQTLPVPTHMVNGVEKWYLNPGTYMGTLNEGCKFGPNDTGFVIMRSSLNRCGVSVFSCVWDPGYTSQNGDAVNPMTIRITVENPLGVDIDKDARIAQLIVSKG